MTIGVVAYSGCEIATGTATEVVEYMFTSGLTFNSVNKFAADSTGSVWIGYQK